MSSLANIFDYECLCGIAAQQIRPSYHTVYVGKSVVTESGWWDKFVVCSVLERSLHINIIAHSLQFWSFLTVPDNHEWDIPEWKGLKARYEHCSFVPESCPQSLWVFGGAQQSGNRNCIQNLQLNGKFIYEQLKLICVSRNKTVWNLHVQSCHRQQRVCRCLIQANTDYTSVQCEEASSTSLQQLIHVDLLK